MTRGLVLVHKSCTTAGTKPFVFLFVFQSQTPLTDSRGNEVIPSGVDWIHFRVLEADERQ